MVESPEQVERFRHVLLVGKELQFQLFHLNGSFQVLKRKGNGDLRPQVLL